MRRVVVDAPASSANLGSGFDVFAIGLRDPRDSIELRASESQERIISLNYTNGYAFLNSDITAAGAVVKAVAKEFEIKSKIDVTVNNRIPIGVGLGSSAASSVGVAVAMNRFFDLGLTEERLLSYAVEGEFAASGARHYDNIAGSLQGGFRIVHQDPLKTVGFPPPNGMAIVVVTPGIELPVRKTEYARSLLPKNLELGNLTKNISLASRVVAGFAKGDVAMIGSGLGDVVIEPARKAMIPWFDEVKSSALEAGAAGVFISGAGPSLTAVVDSLLSEPRRVRKAMTECFAKHGILTKSFVTTVGGGARIATEQ
ncbi:MAG: homoserine kinase [Candidatus Thermoplasmatota archaeon]|nr:homoserine kinase [Candidatus Thermoplasmatota archaeon]